VKALWRAVSSLCGGSIKFKTTLKGASMLMNSAFRDLWMPGLCFFVLLASIITGFVKLAQGPTLASPLIISILWAFVAAGARCPCPPALQFLLILSCHTLTEMVRTLPPDPMHRQKGTSIQRDMCACMPAVPPFLALYYATLARGPSLAWLCRASLVLSLAAGLVAVLLMWALYPVHYDYAQVRDRHPDLFYTSRSTMQLDMWQAGRALYYELVWPHGGSVRCSL
jgi:hypothetical protein